MVSSSLNFKAWKLGDKGSRGCKSRFMCKGLRTRHWCPREGGDVCPSSSRESESVHPPPFGSVQTLHGLDGSHPRWWQWSLLRLLIPMLIPSRNTLTDTPRENVLAAVWASFSPVKMTHKNNPHRCPSIFKLAKIWLNHVIPGKLEKALPKVGTLG